MLSSPTYLVFDEWWGGLQGRDNLAAVLGRQAEQGALRLGLAARRRLWFGDDKRYVNVSAAREGRTHPHPPGVLTVLSWLPDGHARASSRRRGRR